MKYSTGLKGSNIGTLSVVTNTSFRKEGIHIAKGDRMARPVYPTIPPSGRRRNCNPVPRTAKPANVGHCNRLCLIQQAEKCYQTKTLTSLLLKINLI